MPHDQASAAAILDTAEATGRVLGDGALYLRMLRRFQQDHPPEARPIRAALASADLALAHRLAHTLKGSAGMIGAHLLHARAASVEQRLRTDGACADDSDVVLLELALQDVLLAIERLLEGVPTAGHHPAMAVPAAAAVGALLRQLAVLLDTGDGAALDLLEQTAPTVKGAIGAVAFSEVMLAANAFDFEGALASLRRALPSQI